MKKEYVMKCSTCGHLKPLEDFDSKYKNNNITGERNLVKKKTCRECSINISQSHARFIDRHGMTSYRYKQSKIS